MDLNLERAGDPGHRRQSRHRPGPSRAPASRRARRWWWSGAAPRPVARPPRNWAEGAATWLTCDVSDPEQVAAMVREAIGWRGRLDAVVNNAGAVRRRADHGPDPAGPARRGGPPR
ncbi:MAG: SDR family oxidoreductase [Caulobacteraceae bacterium]